MKIKRLFSIIPKSKWIYFGILTFSLFYFIVQAIRYCDIPLWANMPVYFIKPQNADMLLYNLSVGYIVSYMFYFLVNFVPELLESIEGNKKVLNLTRGLLVKISITTIEMYKNILAESNTTALINNFVIYKDFEERMKSMDFTKIIPLSIFYLADGIKLSTGEPLAFGVIMQLKCIQSNVEKALKHKFFNNELEDILIYMSSASLYDLVALVGNGIYTNEKYDFFNIQSHQNITAYFNLYMYSLKLIKYCYEQDLYNEQELEMLGLTQQ